MLYNLQTFFLQINVSRLIASTSIINLQTWILTAIFDTQINHTQKKILSHPNLSSKKKT